MCICMCVFVRVMEGVSKLGRIVRRQYFSLSAIWSTSRVCNGKFGQILTVLFPSVHAYGRRLPRGMTNDLLLLPYRLIRDTFVG